MSGDKCRGGFRGKVVNKASQQASSCVDDPYEKSEKNIHSIYKGTGVNERLANTHRCEWDDNHPESPERLTSILNRLEELNLLSECKIVRSQRDDIEEIIKNVHNAELIENLKQICASNKVKRKECSTKFDSVYFHQNTYKEALRAAAAVVNLVEAVCMGYIQNGFAIVRPPGHHAMENEFNGYCFFNNTAIAADYCLRKNFVKKILIVDFDVHHGQGIQRKFYNTDNVLYFSAHRYEHGTFWPNLKESNFDHIGKGEGRGYNINVPLNETGLTDSDYLAIVFYLLLPVAYEFNPELIIISAGYDCCIGCPEGRMMVTPGFYAHLISLLSSLANGNILVVLEGGYNVDSLSEGVALTLSALLNYTCPKLEPITTIRPSVIETINNIRRSLHKFWSCFQLPKINNIISREHMCVVRYYNEQMYEEDYPKLTADEKLYFRKRIEALQYVYQYRPIKVCYFYDDKMLGHAPKPEQSRVVETPTRLKKVVELLYQSSVISFIDKFESTPRDDPFYKQYVIHDPDYIEAISNLCLEETSDVYINDQTNLAIKTAYCGLLNMVDEIMDPAMEKNAGIALVRPPGHHAEENRAMGFCIFNNVAITAHYLLKSYNINRVLIVDFDVHHGNGTQKFFYNTNRVMYISVHRYDNGRFFPKQDKGDLKFHGSGIGEGFNLNIPFSDNRMGDAEYMTTFFNVILPVAYSYSPDFVLVSAGFDAGIHDPLGGYSVKPETFGHMVNLLKALANGKLILCLEGGYNPTTLSYSVIACIKALIGQPIPPIENLVLPINANARKTLLDVMRHFKSYWPVLQTDQNLSNVIYKHMNYVEYDQLTPDIVNGSFHEFSELPNEG